MDAHEYNEKVWGSTEMLLARQHLLEALRDLNDESKGWGRLVLDNALGHTKLAIDNIVAMMAMDNE